MLATQQVASAPDSLLLLDSPEAGIDAGQEGAGAGSIFLHIGTRLRRSAWKPCSVIRVVGQLAPARVFMVGMP